MSGCCTTHTARVRTLPFETCRMHELAFCALKLQARRYRDEKLAPTQKQLACCLPPETHTIHLPHTGSQLSRQGLNHLFSRNRAHSSRRGEPMKRNIGPKRVANAFHENVRGNDTQPSRRHRHALSCLLVIFCQGACLTKTPPFEKTPEYDRLSQHH